MAAGLYGDTYCYNTILRWVDCEFTLVRIGFFVFTIIAIASSVLSIRSKLLGMESPSPFSYGDIPPEVS